PTDFLDVPLDSEDPWGEDTMTIRTTARPEAAPDGTQLPPAYVNTVTHWWDGSQIYGSSEERCRLLRTGSDGMMRLEEGALPEETSELLHGIDLTRVSDNYWVGLSLLHTLFAKEHNAT